MLTIKTISETTALISKIRQSGKNIGFVPTMGALHPGHVSLIERARQETDFVVCSIFVNPIQFNKAEDLEKYPRTLEADQQKLESAGCDLVFVPEVKEMYPEEAREVYDFGHMDKVMEGQFRPGHFNGVAVVVKRLFDIIQPHFAYFGEKDFQQLAIIKALVNKLRLPVNIVSCATMREPSGLAMSSRNERLNAEDRQTASGIYRAMKEAKAKVPHISPRECEAFVISKINELPGMETEYFSLVNADSLLPATDWEKDKPVVGCVAAYISGVRLIDNIMFF